MCSRLSALYISSHSFFPSPSPLSQNHVHTQRPCTEPFTYHMAHYFFYIPSSAFFTFSSTFPHCSMSGSLGAARKNVRLNVPRLKMCCRLLYSRPTSRLIHSLRSMTLLGDLSASDAFRDLWISIVLFALSRK